MNRKSLTNIAASVHQRLLNKAKATDRPFNEVLQYFGMERFLYRLSDTVYAESFVLKGALLFRVWDTPDTRATRDIDFLAYMSNSPDKLVKVIREICAVEFTDDGLAFDSTSVEAHLIKEGANYEGVRVRLLGLLGKAVINLQIDVGFGDVVHPAVQQIDYPTILDLPGPRLRGYPPETVIAEKTEAMIKLGRFNSRMKDFYDIWRLARQFSFSGDILSTAIRGTMDQRQTEIMDFDSLRAEVLENVNIEKQWQAFLRKTQLEAPTSFTDILLLIENLLGPVLSALKHGHYKKGKWLPSGSWV